MDTSYLTQQVNTIIDQLHNLFDEIGVPTHERDSRESELFSSLSETLHNHLRRVASEKNEMIEEGQRIITTIRQMEASLDDTKANGLYAPKEDDLSVTYPLVLCLQVLKEKHKTISKLHQERYEQVRKLLQALESYSSHLEPTFLQIKLPPVSPNGTIPPTFDLSPAYISSVDAEFTRVYEEYTRRCATVRQMSEEIVKLWAELGTPQAQTDDAIVRCSHDAPEQLGLHDDDIARLRGRREKLLEEKRVREKRLKELRITVESLWDRLGVEEHERKAFLAGNRGCGLRVINDLEDELSRLNELKRQNLHLFVEDARTRLHALWDELFISEEEAVEFTPMFCDVYSDALLSAHESEISRLETLKEQRAPTLQLIAKHHSLIKDREDLAASSQDASRLMLKGQKGERRDPTRLLREEKMRKRIAKDLPKVEQELGKVLEQWEEEYGRPFLVFGERYLDTIAATSASAKPVPPRSKTPNGLPPARATRPVASVSRVPSTREPSTVRSKTPISTATRNATAILQTAANGRSPSKIPSRVPLGAMQHGGNSPERQHSNYSQQGKENGTMIRKAAPSMMAPPPKMRDFMPPPPLSTASTPSSIFPEDFSRSGSIVRHIPPEDPYNDHHNFSQSRLPNSSSLQRPLPQPHTQGYRSMPPPPRPAYGNPHHQQQHSRFPDNTSTISSAPSLSSSVSSRQISGTSTVASQGSGGDVVASGNENWQTYDDEEVVEPEPDASDAYWRKVRLQQQARGLQGRFGRPGIGQVGAVGGVGGAGREGSETAWTDTEDGVE